MIKLTVKYKIFLINLINLIKLIKFVIILYKKHVFRDGNPVLVLSVIQEYIKLEYSNFPSTLVNSRTIQDSSILFDKLVNAYLKTSSSVVLNQLLEVLRVEFIERRNNVHEF